jgi:hypothetical protein
MTEMGTQDQVFAIATAIANALRQQDPLTPDQQRVALQYRMIRNGLGNYGGHGDAGNDVAVIRMTQTVVNRRVSRLTFEDPLPVNASQLTLYVRARDQKIVVTLKSIDPQNRSYVVLDDPDDDERIERVDVLDRLGAPIAAGAPTVVTQGRGPSKTVRS